MQEGNSVVRQNMIVDGLRALGLGASDLVVVHSSLSSFGWVDGGADAVIDALLATVAPGGTVVMPTLTFGPFTPENPPPLFDPGTSAGIVGRIPEVFRQRPAARRSLHPTHSVAAIGPLADELIADHELSRTPIGTDGAWGRIAQRGGRILMLGASLRTCTMMHGPEEMLIPGRCTDWVDCRILTLDGVRTVRVRLHQRLPQGTPEWGFIRVTEQLERTGALRRGTIGPSPQVLMDAERFWVAAMADIERSVVRELDGAGRSAG